MALSEQDREWVKLIARELAFEAIREAMVEHIRGCPHGKKLIWAKAMVYGIGIGLGLVGGKAGWALLRSLTGM